MSEGINNNSGQKLGLIALIAIVISSMIGSGIDGLPQNMAQNSALGPVLIAWMIAGFGIYFIAETFIYLSQIRPDLQDGIYMYASQGFGAFVAFIVAWGYWLMCIFSNVAYGVMVMDALNYFIPGYFQGGNNLASIIGTSVLIWGFNFLTLSGVRDAGIVNTIGTFAKLIPLVCFVGILVYAINYHQLTSNLWGETAVNTHNDIKLSIFSQILSPLDVALWSFIGIEGAVVLSGRVKNRKDIAKATFWGFFISLTLCVLVSLLPFGVLTQHQLSLIPTPSTAGVLKAVVGNWGEWLINVGVVISVLAAWLAWTMLCAELPMSAAQNCTFPKIFAKKNSKGAASVSLWISSGLMQLVILLVYFSHNAWLTLLNVSAVMVLPAYLASTAYLFKLSISDNFKHNFPKHRLRIMLTSVIGMIFCLFMVYASNYQYVVMTPLLLTCGLPFFIIASKENRPNEPIFAKHELIYLAILIILDIVTLVTQ